MLMAFFFADFVLMQAAWKILNSVADFIIARRAKYVTGSEGGVDTQYERIPVESSGKGKPNIEVIVA